MILCQIIRKVTTATRDTGLGTLSVSSSVKKLKRTCQNRCLRTDFAAGRMHHRDAKGHRRFLSAGKHRRACGRRQFSRRLYDQPERTEGDGGGRTAQPTARLSRAVSRRHVHWRARHGVHNRIAQNARMMVRGPGATTTSRPETERGNFDCASSAGKPNKKKEEGLLIPMVDSAVRRRMKKLRLASKRWNPFSQPLSAAAMPVCFERRCMKFTFREFSAGIPTLRLVVPCKNKRYMLKFLDESSGGQD